MIYGTHFIFNGHDSRDYNLILCSVGNDNENELNMGLDLNVINVEKNGKFYDYGAQYNDVLRFNMTVVPFDKHILSRDEIREYMRIFDDCNELKWLTVFDGDDKEYNYYCRIISKRKYKYGGNVIGFTFEVQCDSQYAYSELKEINLLQKDAEPTKLSFIKESFYRYKHSFYLDSDVEIEPIFKFNYNCETLPVKIYLGIWKVNNKQSFPFDLSVVSGSDRSGYLLIDCEHQCIFTDKNEDLSYSIPPKFNEYDCPVFKRGKNELEIIVSDTVDSISVSYREKYKLGEF